jgi:hypothetical protein
MSADELESSEGEVEENLREQWMARLSMIGSGRGKG